MYDLVLANGLVCDPKNRVFTRLDVGIRGGRIAALSAEPLSGRQVFDCAGKVVAPGFIDIHAHEDPVEAGHIQTDITLRALKMGVTTFVGGNCGMSQEDWSGYRRLYDRTQPVHQVLLAGHITLRRMAGAEDKYAPVTAEQLETMCALLREEMERGCRGLSFGIRYEPGVTLEEMCALSAVVREFGGIVTAHVRNDAVGAVDSFEEFLEIGRRTGVRLQVSHIGSMAAYGSMDLCLGAIDACGAHGVDVAVDCYPYDAFSTYIGATTYDDGFTDRYGDDLSRIEITEGEYKGPVQSMEIFQKVRREHPEYLTVGHFMRQDEIDRALTHPRVMLGSDGILQNGAGHPRAAGSFPRFLRQYVWEKKLLSLPEAIAKCTCQPAERVRLDRGALGVGDWADVTVFDPEILCDRATFDEPALPPVGIELVLLEGVPALEKGRVLRPDLGRSL